MIKRCVFPYFGGKSRVSKEVWARFGKTDQYLEPFGGSLAVTLRNPNPDTLKSETVNDFDGFICNFWRSVTAFPEETARYADWPVSQADLTARHRWLVRQADGLTARLVADPDYCDPKIAGWWVWGISQWVGSGWCSSKLAESEKRPHLGNHGMGVHSLGQRPHLGDHGMGVHSLGQRPHLGDHGMGGVYDLYAAIARRLRFTRVTCCDWISLKSQVRSGQWSVFLDPPYTAKTGRNMSLYQRSSSDEATLGESVAQWAVEIGERHRVALCGIEGEYQIPDSWDRYYWKTGGYSMGGRERAEVIWFSPACEPANG